MEIIKSDNTDKIIISINNITSNINNNKILVIIKKKNEK